MMQQRYSGAACARLLGMVVWLYLHHWRETDQYGRMWQAIGRCYWYIYAKREWPWI